MQSPLAKAASLRVLTVAIVALAALPPPVTKNSRAIAFVLGDGKRSTRKMKSTTAIPAHSTSGRAGREPAQRCDVSLFSFTGQPYCVL